MTGRCNGSSARPRPPRASSTATSSRSSPWGMRDDLHYYVMPLIRGAGLDRVILELRDRKVISFDGSDPDDADLLNVARTLLDRSSGGGSAGPVDPVGSPRSV